ncbi:hypothetical protein SAMN02745164_02173 [Marinitoga hydrogenitolerans DSM 16785]|uniref:Uncharacterized protein n=1 Tax=Marinitoga hydrogenitolerans (strain DSM 16785 / JCM 12826 / AT1271) TaxID=1122195 RepID=A0A1M5AEP2_MARH1|nr:hypothetical protein [Marinitoga hydrogenitolerans]SHF28741.1 hypothetical protein SAMN02745164_02173 [Marinitoga hydrogenitolerans DSM 16785]
MLFMFKSKVRYILNIISWSALLISILILPFSYFKFQNNIYLNKMKQIKTNEKILSEYKSRIKLTEKSNKELYNFLDFLEQIKTKIYLQSLNYTPSTLNATILIEVIDGMKIISPYQIKEIGTLDLSYKQYKILEMKK